VGGANTDEIFIPGELIPDEGWWNSILTDEEKYLQSINENSNQERLETNSLIKNDWLSLKSIFTNDEVIQLKVAGYNRGGLLVEGSNIQGFVPISHLVSIPSTVEEEERKELMQSYLGKELALKIIELVPEDERLVFSERAALAGEGKRKAIFENIQPGDNVWGTVTNVTDFGAFIDLGGLEGLIHVSELSWGRVQNPGDILCEGQRIEAQVLSVSKENARVALSYKRLVNNPWDSILEIYSPGDVVTAKITSITKFGAFARLKEGVEGLIHISTMHIPEPTGSIDQFLQIDQCVQVRILHIDKDKKRIGLSLE
jgi:small subunit ribosomal protein S1